MNDSPSDRVSISDGQRSPRTTTDGETDNDLTIPERLKREFKPKWLRFSRALPVSIPTFVGSIFLYLTLLIAIAATINPYNAFGVISATTGAILAAMLYHPDGALEYHTKYHRIIYYGLAIMFLLIGFHYMLMGYIFEHPY